jgi:hypothetical protein
VYFVDDPGTVSFMLMDACYATTQIDTLSPPDGMVDGHDISDAGMLFGKCYWDYTPVGWCPHDYAPKAMTTRDVLMARINQLQMELCGALAELDSLDRAEARIYVDKQFDREHGEIDFCA